MLMLTLCASVCYLFVRSRVTLLADRDIGEGRASAADVQAAGGQEH